jgi:hypothetical protein
VLIHVIGPNFVAGVVLDAEGEAVCKAAPILKWTLGLSRDELSAALRGRGLKATMVRTPRAARRRQYCHGSG